MTITSNPPAASYQPAITAPESDHERRRGKSVRERKIHWHLLQSDQHAKKEGLKPHWRDMAKVRMPEANHKGHVN